MHSLLHTKDLGIIEGRLVEILEGLGDEEEGQEERVDSPSDSLVLLWSLCC